MAREMHGSMVAQEENLSCYLLNAFSLKMLPAQTTALRATELAVDDAARLAVRCLSAVGHRSTAELYRLALGVPVPYCRQRNVRLYPGDYAVVGQYVGARRPEGCRLPPSPEIRWMLVEVLDASDL
jgi:hypothetical protein